MLNPESKNNTPRTKQSITDYEHQEESYPRDLPLKNNNQTIQQGIQLDWTEPIQP